VRCRWRCCPWFWSRARVSKPYQHSAVSIYGLLFGLDDFIFERCNVLIIQLEAQLEGSIGDASFPLQQVEYLGQDRIKVHHRPSAYPCVRLRARSSDHGLLVRLTII
jgi:hypothetical protein